MSRGAGQQLYDAACDVLYAAQSLRRAAVVDGGADAVPATLGCLQAAVEQLAASAEQLAAGARASSREQPGADSVPDALAELTQTLRAAARACDHARASVAAGRDRDDHARARPRLARRHQG